MVPRPGFLSGLRACRLGGSTFLLLIADIATATATATATDSDSSLNPIDGKGDDLIDPGGTGDQHDQTIDAKGDTGAFRQTVVQGVEQPSVDGDHRQTGHLPAFEIGLESPLLFLGIGELVVSVGELDTIDPGLEPLGHRRLAGSDSRKGRLGCRVVEDECRATATEPGFDKVAHQQVEPAVAIVAKVGNCTFDALAGGRGKLGGGSGVGVDAEVVLEGFEVGDPL